MGSLAIESSRDAGVLEQDISAAETRKGELDGLIKNAQRRKRFCGLLPCCCGQDIEWKNKGEMQLESVTHSENPQKQTDAEYQEDRLRALEVEVEERQRHVEEEKKRLLMQTVLPSKGSSSQLQE